MSEAQTVYDFQTVTAKDLFTAAESMRAIYLTAARTSKRLDVLEQLAEVVKLMRQKQRLYFSCKDPVILGESKALERRADILIDLLKKLEAQAAPAQGGKRS